MSFGLGDPGEVAVRVVGLLSAGVLVAVLVGREVEALDAGALPWLGGRGRAWVRALARTSAVAFALAAAVQVLAVL